jgi:nucleoside-triphosphatase THEP1
MKKIPSKPLDPLWIKASVVGSFWASIEIIFGSFLHNLRFPMSGTLLSFISVFLLVSFIQIWKEKGLIIRAGLICALLKSISPSAVIIGPMTGIFIEAALLELAVSILGMNLAGYLTGGALAVTSTLLHKLVSLLILYGFDFIKILDVLYRFSVKQIKLENPEPLALIVIITIVYAVTGITGAAAGYFTGKRYLMNSHIVNPGHEIALGSEEGFFSSQHDRRYSVFLLIVIFLSVVTSLLLINLNLAIPATVFSVVFVSFCLFRYRTSLNRLKKISTWVQFCLITVIAAFLWNGISEKNMFSVNGLIIGLKMVARAAIVIIGFAAISTELKNPIIKSLLYNKGFENLYKSLNVAFSALPGIIEGLPKPKRLFGRTGISFPALFKQAERLVEIIEKDHSSGAPVIIITGEREQGKTMFVKKITDDLKELDFSLGGFLSVGIHNSGERTGFKIMDVQTLQQTELCTSVPNDSWIRYGRYYFNPEGISEGNEILNVKNVSEKDLVIIDEVGPLELKGQGWSRSIKNLVNSASVPQLWVVRKSLVNNVLKKWIKGDAYIFDIAEDNSGMVVELISEITGDKNGRKTT